MSPQPVGNRSGLGQPSREVPTACEVRGGTNGMFPVAFLTPRTMHGPQWVSSELRVAQKSDSMSDCECPVTSAQHVCQNPLQCFHSLVHFPHPLFSWQLSPLPFQAKGLNPLWVINSEESHEPPSQKKGADSCAQFCYHFKLRATR